MKIRGTDFCLSPFSNIKKYTYDFQNTLHGLFAYTLFQILKKEYLQISKYLAQFFAYSLFQILKKYTYESQNTWHSFFDHPFFKYYESQKHDFLHIKTIKVKYIISACILKLL